MEYLHGGREKQIARSGNAVHRPRGFWSASVHKLLVHLKEHGFHAAPEFLGFDEQRNEMLSYIPGYVCNYPLDEAAASAEALSSAARLLREYHDATIAFLAKGQEKLSWMLPSREPQEVICHGDYAPYNVVLHGKKAIGIIDFDTAHPGPRAWDLCYALYRWAPLKNPENLDRLGDLEQQRLRARQFCDAYGFPLDERASLVDLMILRLQALVDFMHAEAAQGNEAFQANIADGHHLSYLTDITYLNSNREKITSALSG